jgi:uncharacterized protein YhfF
LTGVHSSVADDAEREEQDVRRFWDAYAKAVGVRGGTPVVMRFGDSDELAEEFASLVMAGTKRAHASLPRDFGARGRRFPRRGDLSVVLDGARAPRCVIRCVDVDVKRMAEVDERFAWDSGGGDRSLRWWVSAHLRYFRRQAAREGFSVGADTELVLERFEVVWPLELADSPAGPEWKGSTLTES